VEEAHGEDCSRRDNVREEEGRVSGIRRCAFRYLRIAMRLVLYIYRGEIPSPYPRLSSKMAVYVHGSTLTRSGGFSICKFIEHLTESIFREATFDPAHCFLEGTIGVLVF